MTTTSRLLKPLVSISNFKNLLKSSENFNKTYRLLDANVGAGKLKELYDTGHIENALYFDTMNCVKPTNLHPRNLPVKACFQDYVGSIGISNKHHIIVYDRSPFGFYAAPRTWWIFKYFGHENISILDGGLNKWNFESGTITQKLPNFKAEKFIIKENKNLIRDFDQIIENIKKPKETVVDVRAPEQFKGLTEPSVGNFSGHIKNSKNIPYNSLFDPSIGSLKDEKQLNEMLKQVTGDKNSPIVASCLTGMTACSLAFAAHLVGYKNVSVYYGSWTEFAQRASNEQCSKNDSN